MQNTDYESLKQVIKQRRAIFPPSYLQKDIPKSLIIELLDCANMAPTHKLTQPWWFVVFKENGLVKLGDQLAELYKTHTPSQQFLQKKYENTREKVQQSGAVIAIVVSYSGGLPQWEELAATACAVQNLWLAASAAGIGGYWSSPGTVRHMRDFLGLGAHEECLGFFYMGFHNESPREASRTPILEKIRWEE